MRRCSGYACMLSVRTPRLQNGQYVVQYDGQSELRPVSADQVREAVGASPKGFVPTVGSCIEVKQQGVQAWSEAELKEVKGQFFRVHYPAGHEDIGD